MSGASASADVIGTTDDEVRLITEPILDNILEGLEANDYGRYAQDFDETLREAIPEHSFLQTNRQIDASIGRHEDREYLGFLNKEELTIVLWKARFSATEDDVLIKLTLSRRKEQYLVTGLWFQ